VKIAPQLPRIKVKLVKREVNGIGVQDHVPLGTEYEVVPLSLRPMRFQNSTGSALVTAIFVDCNAVGGEGWMPRDLFEEPKGGWAKAYADSFNQVAGIRGRKCGDG
jgi:hypothetical protein